MSRALLVRSAAVLIAITNLASAQPSQVSEFFDEPLSCTTVNFEAGKGYEDDWNLSQNNGRIYTLYPPNDQPLRVAYKWGVHDQEMLFESQKDTRTFYRANISSKSTPRPLKDYKSIIELSREADGSIVGGMVANYKFRDKPIMHVWRWECERLSQS